ncbi:MAG: hypothetical protein IT385_16110 [Deltaproteobacteria bacterium]|nr:hypothetical protein [Deltaproteobacteria bacterium]
MDLTQARSLLDRDLDQLLAKASDPKATLTALAGKINATVAAVESHILVLDERAMALPGAVAQEQAMVHKVEAIIAKADQDGRADLAAAARQRLAKHQAQVAALGAELGKNEAERAECDTLLVRCEERLTEIEARGVELGGIDAFAPEPEAAPEPAYESASANAAAAPAPKPAASAPKAAAPAPKPAAPAVAAPAAKAPAKPAAKGGLDDEFAALLSEMNVDLSKVELPNRKKPALPATKDDDLGLPDLVTVADNELPEGEELEPLPTAPTKGGKPAAPATKPATPAGKVAAAGKPTAPPAAKAGPPSTAAKGAAPAASEAPKKSKTWLWITLGATALGGAGLAVAHFALGLF